MAKEDKGSMENSPNPVDIHVGKKIRQLRTLKGFTQEKLGQAVGITFQQVQKYERGTNRVGASRLYDLSKVLEVPVSVFFEGLGQASSYDTSGSFVAEADTGFTEDPFKKRETLELIRAYYKIPDPGLRKTVFDLAKSLAKQTDTESA